MDYPVGLADARLIGGDILVVRFSPDVPQDEADALVTEIRAAVIRHGEHFAVTSFRTGPPASAAPEPLPARNTTAVPSFC